jgi:hypothetical protein
MGDVVRGVICVSEWERRRPRPRRVVLPPEGICGCQRIGLLGERKNRGGKGGLYLSWRGVCGGAPMLATSLVLLVIRWDFQVMAGAGGAGGGENGCHLCGSGLSILDANKELGVFGVVWR